MKSCKMLIGLMLTLLLVNFNFVFAADPIADFSFDVDASDATGNFNGTLEGDAAIVDNAERGGKVLSLTADGYVSVPPAVAATMENWSFTAWVDFAGTNGYAAIMGMGNAIGGSTPYCDFHIRSNGTLSFYVSEIDVWPGDGSAQVCDLNLFDLDPGWAHVALTFTLGSVPLFYVNGEVQTSTDWNSTNDHDVSPKLINPEVVMIGKDSFNQTTLTNTRIDEVKFFDVALTAEEVAAIYTGATSVKKEASLISSYQLAQNYPNPFNPTTQIQYTLGANTNVEIAVYDLLGQEVATLVNGYQNAGNHHVVWDASGESAGVYLYQIKTNGVVETKKMLLVK